jgi:alkaline phosphatase D
MSVDFKTFVSLAPAVSAAKLPVLLRGRHGIGKSQVVYQLAASMGLPVIERRASQMTEGDLVGLPSIDGNRTSFNPPDWFKEACEEPSVLFLDEVDRATLEVRQGIFELTDSRKLNGHYLHEDTIVFAAINGGEHGEQYQVNEMDPAELDRWSVWDIDPTVEDWLNWGKENVDSLVWDFINQNREHLEHKGDIEPNKRYPSRRSWKRLNDVLVQADLIKEASPSMFQLAQSFVGFEAAVALNDYALNYERVVTVEQLLNGERVEALAAMSLNEHCAM